MFDVKKKKMKRKYASKKIQLCFSCGAKGHFIKNCPLMLKEQHKGKEKHDSLPIMNDSLLTPKGSEESNPLLVVEDYPLNQKRPEERDPLPTTKYYSRKQESKEEPHPLPTTKDCPLKKKGQENYDSLHATKDCSLKQKGQEEHDYLHINPSKSYKPTSQYQCYGCGSIGHEKNNCPLRHGSKLEKISTILHTQKSIQTISSFDEGKSSDQPAVNGVTVPSPSVTIPSPDTETEKVEGKSSAQPDVNGIILPSPDIGTKLFEVKRADSPDTEKLTFGKADLQIVKDSDKVPAVPTVEPEILEDLEFAWGKKGGVGGKKREIQFYKSFTYDGTEYSLHDCVYLHKEGQTEPYIGKLIKIWQHTDKSKKIKVQWFFHPKEISHCLGNEKVLDNELFLASGEGTGLSNINLLEAIGGKCNVICISKDSRNPQPSAEKVKMADYVFYRTFDVSSGIISDKMDEKVGGLECQFVFNRIGSEIDDVIPGLKSQMTGNKQNANVSNGLLQNLTEKSKTVNSDEKMNSSTASSKDRIRFAEEYGDRPSKKARVDKSTDESGGKNQKMIQDLPIRGNDNINLVDSTSLREKSTGLAEGKKNKSVQDLPVKENDKQKLLASASLKDKITFAQANSKSMESAEGKNQNDAQNLPVRGNDEKKSVSSASLKGKIMPAQTKGKSRDLDEDRIKKGYKDSRVPENNEKNLVGSGFLKEKHIATQGKDKSMEIREGNKKNTDRGSPVHKDDERKLSSSSLFKDKPTALEAKDSRSIPKRVNGGDLKDKSSLKKARLDDSSKNHNNSSKTFDRNNSEDFTKEKTSNGKLKKVLALESTDENIKVKANAIEVTRRPDAVKASWFEKIPWEERMRKAHEKNTLVLLQNLDPKYTSEEVEDIIWGAFNLSCDAKVLQKNAFSSPHFGQALIILKTKDAVSKVINKLDEEVLMLLNGRPLVACIAPPPCMAKQQSTFFGHLVIENLGQHQRETKEAVSTSHCSQPNTIEFEMAMEWCLLQTRSEAWWKRFHKQQGNELRNLKAQLKSK